MRVALLLLALCGLAAAYSVGTDASAVPQRVSSSPVDPVGPIADARANPGADRRLHQDFSIGGTLVAAGASSSSGSSGQHGAVMTIQNGQGEIISNDNGKIQTTPFNSGRHLLWSNWNGGWGGDNHGSWGGNRGWGGNNGGGGGFLCSFQCIQCGRWGSSAAAAAAAAASNNNRGWGRRLLWGNWGGGEGGWNGNWGGNRGGDRSNWGGNDGGSSSAAASAASAASGGNSAAAAAAAAASGGYGK